MTGFDEQCGCNTQISEMPKGNAKELVSYFDKINRILDDQGAVATLMERKRFAKVFERAIRLHEFYVKRWAILKDKPDDIIALIKKAISVGDEDEAVWWCFLAAHFGRPSAHGEHQIRSASNFLCAFGESPVWTWKKVSERPQSLEEWLFNNADKLGTLRYGNHRKYESQKSSLIWATLNSFIDLANRHGGPADLVHVDDGSGDPFDVAYRRLSPVRRFGRTGRFDFLVLLLDLKLISGAPKSCYLRGATGPLNGAKLLWGDLSPKVLDQLAANLAERLEISPIVMEDALCNWQK